MAALDMHEQEQIDAIKAWWKENGTKLIVVVLLAALAAGAVFGWKFWQGKRDAEASALFAKVVSAMNKNDLPGIDDAVQPLLNKYSGTIYAARAQLLAARASSADGKPEDAVKRLRWVIGNGKDEGLRNAARLQLGALMLDQKKYDDALKLLDAPHPDAFNALYADLRGDIYVAQGKKQEARAAYQQALNTSVSDGNFATMVRLQLNSLGGAASAVVPAGVAK